MLETPLRAVRAARRLSVKRLLAQYGADAAMGDSMKAQIGDYPKRDATQIYDRCDPYCRTLTQLLGVSEAG